MKLVTGRLVLREFRESDWPAVLAYQSHPRYLQYYEWQTRTAAQVQRFVAQFIAQQRDRPRLKYQLAVVLQADGRLIGNCGFRLAAVDHQGAAIGYELAPAAWGRGYATEATRELVRFGFTRLQRHRIGSQCLAENVRSARVLERLGMRLEDRQEKAEYFKGRWWDTLIYGLLAEEWRDWDSDRPAGQRTDSGKVGPRPFEAGDPERLDDFTSS